MAEFGVINRLQEIFGAAHPAGAGCVIGIGDDAAILDVSGKRQLAVCTDTLVEGVHFRPETAPEAIGHKSLAVNLSDLAAMGAEPAWFFLALSLPSADPVWLDAFAHGMADLAGDAAIALAGGDTTSGHLSITITALGFVERGMELTRAGAGEGDLIVVSGRPGSAAHALQCLRSGIEPDEADLMALEYPRARLSLGRALRGLASSCIDISDGLLADLGHILKASGVGADLQLRSLPIPASLITIADESRWPLQLAGGDDYELCFTIPPDRRSRLEAVSHKYQAELSVIGAIRTESGISLWEPGGGLYTAPGQGYEHFSVQESGS